jgi:hypothetical protein
MNHDDLPDAATDNAGDPMPRWWYVFRRIVIFGLGVAVIIDSLTEKNTASVGKLLIGLLLIGFPPIEEIMALAARRRG